VVGASLRRPRRPVQLGLIADRCNLLLGLIESQTGRCFERRQSLLDEGFSVLFTVDQLRKATLCVMLNE